MHALPTRGAQTQLWAALADAVRRCGPAAVRRALGWQLYNVPDVSGAHGTRTLSESGGRT